MPALRVNDLLPDSRLDQIEAQIRREFPSLPDGAIFNTFVESAGYVEQNGLELPKPPRGVVAILIPNPKWPKAQPQYRMASAPRWLDHFRHYEQQRDRLVNAPDVALLDFRAVATKAVEVANYYRSLLN